MSEEQVALTIKVTQQLCKGVTELAARGPYKWLWIRNSAVQGEDDWEVGFCTHTYIECSAEGNLHISNSRFEKLQELMRILKVNKRSLLTEALMSDDEEIQEAASLRAYELELIAARLAEVHEPVEGRSSLNMEDEKEVPLTSKITNGFLEVITELVIKHLTVSTRAANGKDGWYAEFYAQDLGNEYELVGNLYIPTPLFKKLQELMRIENASEEDLPEALVHDDEEIRDAADTRIHELAREARLNANQTDVS